MLQVGLNASGGSQCFRGVSMLQGGLNASGGSLKHPHCGSPGVVSYESMLPFPSTSVISRCTLTPLFACGSLNGHGDGDPCQCPPTWGLPCGPMTPPFPSPCGVPSTTEAFTLSCFLPMLAGPLTGIASPRDLSGEAAEALYFPVVFHTFHIGQP